MEECHFLYCAVDRDKTVIKIGVAENPMVRESGLSGTFKEVKVVFALKFQPKHSDYSGILNDGANYLVSPYKKDHEYFVKPKKIALKFEMFFKKKFADQAIQGNEWFRYSDESLCYIERLFRKLSKTESTALTSTELRIY